jgi:pyrimidine deaminase RibD-like protein
MLSTFTTTIRSEVEVAFDPEGDRRAQEVFKLKHQPYLDARAKYESEELPKKFATWDADRKNRPLPKSWLLPEIVSTKSGGSTLTKQADGSILVTGTNPPIETLTISLSTTQPTITAIRIEALTHSSLVKNGPGRASNGNFALTDFKVTATPKKGGAAQEVSLKNPRSTFEQKGLGIAGAIDADPVTSGWAVDPQFGKDHAAAFDFASPIQNAEGTTFVVTMKFHNNVGHGMGRPRLSLSTQVESLPLEATLLSSETQTLLDLAPEKRSPEQSKKLLEYYRQLDAEWVRLNTAEQNHSKLSPRPNVSKVLISSEGVPAVRLHTQGGDFLKETHFLKRGDPNNKEGVAPVGYLQVLMRSEPESNPWQKPTPKDSKLSYRRTALAEWMCDTEKGAGGLLARVIVNRLWQHHFGRGLVSTPSDFGFRGEKPSHPELLDYLAEQLIASGWKLKSIHKLMLMSAAYQQSSKTMEVNLPSDRENSLFWKQPVRRLEAEIIRDAMLSVGGQLDAKMFGPGTLDESSKRRSIYFTMKRSRLIPSLVIFDAPDGTVGIGDRPATTIAPQALHLMNNAQVRGYAKGLGERMSSESLADSIRRGYRLTLSRDPNAEELSDGMAFVAGQVEAYTKASKPNAKLLALTDFAQVLLCLNEFVFVE